MAVKQKISVIIPLSNNELAQLAQTTPETISRTLNQLRAEGLVTWDASGHLVIESSVLREALRKLS